MTTNKIRPQHYSSVERLERRENMSAGVVVNEVLQGPQPQVELNTFSQATGYGSQAVEYAHNELGLTGLGQTVAIIDSGIAYDHYALGGGWGANYRVVGGWDFAENDANPYDDAPGGFHGTHVAGIVGSDDTEFTGVAPERRSRGPPRV